MKDNMIIEGGIELHTGDVKRLVLKKFSYLTDGTLYRLEIYPQDDSNDLLTQASLSREELQLLQKVIDLVLGS